MVKRDRYFGVGEPLIQRQRDQAIDAAAYLDLVAGLGCTAYRSWMHITEIDGHSARKPEACGSRGHPDSTNRENNGTKIEKGRQRP